MTRAQFFLTAIGATVCALALQSPARTLVGTFEGFIEGGVNLRVRGDDGANAVVECGAATEVRRVAPGEKSLREAQTIRLDELKPGDRLLISYPPDTPVARRIVVMAAAAITARNEAQRREWNERGVSGVAASMSASGIVVKQRTLMSDSQTTVTVAVTAATKYRRYRPGSNSYTESVEGALEQIRAGDQVRARGVKAADGSRIEAEEVVFGSFVTKAGTVVSADAATNSLTVRDLDTDRPLPVRLTSASLVKRFPELPTAPAVMGGISPTPRVQPSMPGPGGPPDLAQMIERLPAFELAEMKPGDTVVFSASPANEKGELLAVVVLANAKMLVQMAQARSSRQSQQPAAATGLGGIGGMGGVGGLDLSGFLP